MRRKTWPFRKESGSQTKVVIMLQFATQIIMNISAFLFAQENRIAGTRTSIVIVIVSSYRALHWVTIEMLCVPVDEEIAEVSDSVVKAITGKSHYFSEGHGRTSPRHLGSRDSITFFFPSQISASFQM